MEKGLAVYEFTIPKACVAFVTLKAIAVKLQIYFKRHIDVNVRF